MRCGKVIRNIVAIGTTLALALAWGAPANAGVQETKRGIELVGTVTGSVGGNETRSWGYTNGSIKHYVYAAQDGSWTGKIWAVAGKTASTISGFGSWDMSRDDALGGPLKNGSCSPEYGGTRCGCPVYKNYPIAGAQGKKCGQ